MVVGILGLQGAFQKHMDSLNSLDINTCIIKYEHDLLDIDALIIPGGESSTMSSIIDKNNLFEPLKGFVEKKPVFATCAGLILLSTNIYNDSSYGMNIDSFDLLDMDVYRNGWGRQVNSFHKDIYIDCINNSIDGIFIRAPKIKKINDASIKVLASFNHSPVMIQKNNILATTFHPELGNDISIHKYFIDYYA